MMHCKFHVIPSFIKTNKKPFVKKKLKKYIKFAVLNFFFVDFFFLHVCDIFSFFFPKGFRIYLNTFHEIRELDPKHFSFLCLIITNYPKINILIIIRNIETDCDKFNCSVFFLFLTQYFLQFRLRVIRYENHYFSYMASIKRCETHHVFCS